MEDRARLITAPRRAHPVTAAAHPASPALVAGGLCVAAGALLPALYLVVRSAEGGLATAIGIAADARTLRLLGHTAGLTATVTTGAVLLGVPLAWLTSRTDMPGRAAWVVLASLPLTVPSYVGGYALVAALGPRGLLQSWLEPLGVHRLPSIYGFTGAATALTLFTYPYVLLSVRAALRGLDPALEEVSRSLGRSRRETFWRVVMPQLRPAIGAGALLVALYVAHDFGAVSLLRYDTFTRAIFVRYRSSFDRTPAAVLGLVLVAATLVLLSAELRTRGRAAYHARSAVRRPGVARLRRWRWPAFAMCALVVAAGLGLPVGIALYWLVRALQSGEQLQLTAVAAWHSVRASATGAVAATVCAWPVALLAVRHPGRFARLVERASFVGYALPGLVVALALVFFAARFAPAVYQTHVLLALAYVVLFLPLAVGALRASLLQVNPALEDASRALGSGRVATLRRVVLPLLRPGMLAGAAMVFLTAMKELPATLLLAPTGFGTLATQVWNATSEAFYTRAAAPSLALIALSSVPLAVMVVRDESRAS